MRTGQDFSNYKPATLRRRVERRLSVNGVTTLAEYARLIRAHPEEATALMKELLISVTNFFRDAVAWQALERRVVPALFEGRHGGDQVRVWSAGCATGEEAYSLAMLLAERAADVVDAPSIQVFATDLDAEAIARAREGLYAEADVLDLSRERLQRFFARETDGYRVRRELRETVLFAHHNVIKDPPFSHLDLVACRNLLIYLNRVVQDRLLETFHFALRPGGYLFLGQSEAADGDGDLFVPVDKAAHIFESRAMTTRPSLPLADRSMSALPPSPRIPDPRPVSERTSPDDLHLRLLEQYAPPSLVVTEEHVLVHASAHAPRFLVVPPGEPTREVLKLVVPELRADLRTALHLAAQQRSTIEVGGLRAPGDTGEVIKLVVRPVLRLGEPLRGYFLVLFAPDATAGTPEGGAVQLRSPAEPESRRLEEELTRVKAQLRATIEQYEVHSEEARAANEELQAMNEELRSAAEELETSKEELQSVNEELTTVNQELKIKIEELGLTNNDFQNLMNSTDIGTIFLDRQLRVKLSTPSAQRIFNLLPSDVGRKLSDITTRLLSEDLYPDIQQVLDRLNTIEREVQTTEGQHFLMRIRPYRTVDDRIDGVSVTFHDVTEWRQAESRVRASEEWLRLLIERAIDYAIFTVTADGRIDSWNPGAERMFGYKSDDIIGRDASLLFTAEDRAEGVPEAELRSALQNGRAIDERWHLRQDGTRLYCSGVMTPLGAGRELRFAKIARDLTVQRQGELDVQRAHAELEDRVNHRTAELQAEVARRTHAQEHITDLLRKLVTAQEDERARIARDLHDQLGQQLTALRLALERHRQALGSDYVSEELHRALTLTADIDREIDFLAWELRPTALDDLGLAAALPRYVEEWSAHYTIKADFQTTGHVQGRLRRDAEVVFYRIAQEALTNVVKHAHARRVGVVLEGRDDAVVLIVEDDGVGFDAAASDARATGIGLVGMRERAALIGATLQIESKPGDSTTIFLRYAVPAVGEATT
jgi:two-component system CheB/CheR fusion protein